MSDSNAWLLSAVIGLPLIAWLGWRSIKRVRDPQTPMGEKALALAMLLAGLPVALAGYVFPAFMLLVLGLVLLAGVGGFVSG